MKIGDVLRIMTYLYPTIPWTIQFQITAAL
jgi:hypothetical protein